MIDDWAVSRMDCASGDLIENPARVIESLIRDEILVERDLVITSGSGTTWIISGARSIIDDYYNGAYVVNVTKNGRYLVNDYTGSTKTFVLNTSVSWAASDKIYIKNINANINTNSFDVIGAGVLASGTTTSTASLKLNDSGASFLTHALVGMRVKNTTTLYETYIHSIDSDVQITLDENIFTSTGQGYEIEGKRSGWKFARTIDSQNQSQQLLNQLLFESHCMLFKSYNQYKLVDLDDGNIVGTFKDDPANGLRAHIVNTQFTQLQNIFTDFTLNYAYNYAKKIYEGKCFVNKNATSAGYLDGLKTYCSDAESDYRISKKYEKNLDWIQDEDTANYLMEKLVLWNTYQRMIVQVETNLAYLKYEIGDRVLIDYDFMMPGDKNNAQVFQIFSKTISPNKKKVQFNLLY